MKTFTLIMGELKDKDIVHSYNETNKKIKNGESVKTTQVALLSTDLFFQGYKIFIQTNEEDCFEIVLGAGNERTSRNIKLSHNLQKLLLSNEFGEII